MAEVIRVAGIEVHDGGPNDLDIEAPVEALHRLADAIDSGGDREVRSDRGAVDVVVTTGKVVISHIGRLARVEGAPAYLTYLAGDVRFLAKGPQKPSKVQYHIHVEHFDDHIWLAPSTEPMTFSLLE